MVGLEIQPHGRSNVFRMDINQLEIKCRHCHLRSVLRIVKSYAVMYSEVIVSPNSVANLGSSVLPSCQSNV